MSTTQHTGHYNLPTFGDNPNDRPSWRGDFTDAMTKIDNQMYANATNITTATAAANNASTAAQQAKESADNAAKLAQTNKTDIAGQASYFNALGVTSVPTAQNLMSTINGKAENTDLTALQGTVSTLSSTVSGKANTADVYTKSQADTRYTKQGGYAGTAQDIMNKATSAGQTASEVNSNLHDLLDNGAAPILLLTDNKSFNGATYSVNVYYSKITHLVTVSFNSTGTSNVTQNSTCVFDKKIPEEYRPTRAFRALADIVTDASSYVDWRIFEQVSADGGLKIDFVKARGTSSSLVLSSWTTITYFAVN